MGESDAVARTPTIVRPPAADVRELPPRASWFPLGARGSAGPGGSPNGRRTRPSPCGFPRVGIRRQLEDKLSAAEAPCSGFQNSGGE